MFTKILLNINAVPVCQAACYGLAELFIFGQPLNFLQNNGGLGPFAVIGI